MKRALVTGASGFVGANLVRRLVQDGHEVSVLARQGSDLWRLADILERLRVLAAPLSDRALVEKAVQESAPQWIFHLAVHGAYSWQTDLARMIESNIVGTGNLIEAALETGFEAFVNTGSSSEYGFKDHAPSEDEALSPNSYYAVTKASATFLCQHIARSRNVLAPTLRLYSVYGPYEDPRRLLPTLICKGLDGKLPVLVDPSIARDYIYVDDVVEAYILAASRKTDDPGAVYNVGTGRQTSLAEIVGIARSALAIEVEPQWGSMPNRLWDSNCWVSDSDKLRSKLGWQPRYDLQAGFERMVGWFRRHPQMIAYYRDQMAAGSR